MPAGAFGEMEQAAGVNVGRTLRLKRPLIADLFTDLLPVPAKYVNERLSP